MMQVARTAAELQSALISKKRILVPTMGSLHAGHTELIAQARKLAGSDGQVVLSIFVNPLQFGKTEDFEKYPRDLEMDLSVADAAGVDLVWAPTWEEIVGPDVETIQAPVFGDELEGKSRPGHFSGVLTVVASLFVHVKPAVAVFGVKDLQQLLLITEMSAQRFKSIEIYPVETVRDSSGLALSSRNSYLSNENMSLASGICKSLLQAKNAEDPVAKFYEVAASQEIHREMIDYAQVLVMPAGSKVLGQTRLVVAVHIGTTRLIDNIALS